MSQQADLTGTELTETGAAQRKSGDADALSEPVYCSFNIFIAGEDGLPVLLGTFQAPFLFIQHFMGDFEKFGESGKPAIGKLFCRHADGRSRHLVIPFEKIFYMY